MTLKELAEKLAQEHGLSVAATTRLLDEAFDHISSHLAKGKDLRFGKLGSFKIVKRKARKARNPKTGESIKVPAKKVVKFKVASRVSDVLNKKKA